MKHKTTEKAVPLLLAGVLMILIVCSLFAILRPTESPKNHIADIYQNGSLLQSIPLGEVTTPYEITVSGDNGCINEIEIRPGSIGIVFANCPDKLCVHQGFINDNRLPITCLPNRVVIVLRTDNSGHPGSIAPDMISY